MPQKGSREYYNNLLFTTDNHFVLFGLNWSINAFRTSQISRRKNKQENLPKGRDNYNSYYKYDPGVYDLIIYSASIQTKSNQTVVRIEWDNPMGANVPTFTHTIPTIFISFEKSL